MTMLTHTGRSFEPSSRPSADNGTANVGHDRCATILQLCVFALTALVAGGVLVGIVALRTAAFVARLVY